MINDEEKEEKILSCFQKVKKNCYTLMEKIMEDCELGFAMVFVIKVFECLTILSFSFHDQVLFYIT